MEAVLLTIALAAGAFAVTRSDREENGSPTEAALARPRPFPDSPPMGSDARDVRSFDAWICHPGYAVTPSAIISVFRQAESGYPQLQCDLFDDLVENDAHLRNLFEQREQAVSGKPWVIQADGQEGDSELAARVLGEALRRLPMIEVFQHLLTFNRYGWSAAEIDWGIRIIEGKPWIVPTWIAPVPSRRFRISTIAPSTGSVDELRLYAALERPDGDPLKPGKWIVIRRSGTWVSRAGLMRTAAWPAMAKRYGFRDWLVYSQRFGMPMPLVTYDGDADEDEIEVAKKILANIGSDGGAVIPKDRIGVSFEDATRGNGENSKAHGGLIAHCNAEMSKLVNGSTLSNDAGAGAGGASYALGEVHDTVRWDNVVFDAERLQEGVRTQLAAPFMQYNALRGAPPLLRVQIVRDLTPEARSKVAVQLNNELGIKVSVGQLRQELGFREPVGEADAAPGPATPITPGAPL